MNVSSTATREARIRRTAALPGLGWKQVNGYWINPRTGRRYDLDGAIDIESLAGSWARRNALAWTRPLYRKTRKTVSSRLIPL